MQWDVTLHNIIGGIWPASLARSVAMIKFVRHCLIGFFAQDSMYGPLVF